jgi:hypothetical protein
MTQVAAPALQCPRCGSTQLEQPSAQVPVIIRCVACNSHWHESDLTGDRLEQQRARHKKADAEAAAKGADARGLQKPLKDAFGNVVGFTQ